MPAISPIPPTPIGQAPFTGATTFLCTFTVLADMPSSMGQADMEGAVAMGLAAYFQGLGLPANVSAQLVATQGNATVLNPTEVVPVAVAPVAPLTPNSPLL